MLTFIHIIGLVLFIYLFCSITYLLIMAVAGLFYKEDAPPETVICARIGIIIPTYRDDHVIVHTVTEALSHDYPANKFSVTVVADSLQPGTLKDLRGLGISVIEIATGMKSRSVHAGLQSLKENEVDVVMLLDADNIMKAGCLHMVNRYFQAGCRAMQCHRTAKNEQTNVALLDAVSEEINNHLFRLGPQALGLSAALSGSGMAFDIRLIKAIFNWPPILENPGEDREIDMQLLKFHIRMIYIPDAWVLDEKVATHDVFEKQRVRWLEAQWYHLRRFFETDIKGIHKGRQYFNKLIQNLLLPRSLYLVVFLAITLMVIVRYATGWAFFFPLPGWWLSLLLFFMLTLAIAMPSKYYSAKTVRAVLSLPLLLVTMLKALFRIRRGRKEFLHTPKSFTGLQDQQK
ncbi:glycosyltransferase [Flavihumibacter solisilvae]|uniref:glycosyltransferase n=1 Tax=Flavihumibacter solisilvae TaxID=1349421 RepID=UPI00068D5354|nr:glycosyltransferase family 2 protein [Flavihumibacter solisilvae]